MFNFLNEAARRVLRGRAARPAAPKPPQSYDAFDPRAPCNLGWTRIDVPDPRHRVRFRIAVDIPKAVPPAPPVTGAGFASAGGGHVEHHPEPPKATTRPVPPRTGIPQAPRADSTFWTNGRC
jgi:hypothetical protein